MHDNGELVGALDTNVTTSFDQPTENEAVDLKVGTLVSRYQILGLLGRGGMGAVYKAYDPELDRSIAIKILTVRPKEGESASRPQARLMREAQALAKLSHPNVVSVHDVGTYDEGVYIAMEYVKGQTLRDWLKITEPTQKEIMHVMIEAGRGLFAAHSEGIVHRDFKPDNVIVGEKGQVKVLDFGLARAAGAEEAAVPLEEQNPMHDSTSGEKLLSKPLTKVGAIVGTTVYMAPEHFRFKELDEKTDQFSFCVTLFEALYGKRPFQGRTTHELEENITSGTVEIPEQAAVPKWIEEIALRGLSVSKEKRYPTIEELLHALTHDPEEAKRKQRISRIRKLLMTSLIILTIALPIGVWYGMRFRTVQLCKAAEGTFAGVWDVATKDAVKKAFLDTKRPYAMGTWQRVEQHFDKTKSDWLAMRSDVCEAKHLRGTQSEELFDLRMRCLNKRIEEMSALINIFSKADAGVVQKAVQASASLGSVALCADEQALREPYAPPPTAAAKAKVAAIRKKLSEVMALNRTGRYRQGRKLAQTLRKQAKAVGYGPLQAEILYQLGDLLDRAGEYKKAQTTLQQAARIAGQCGYGVLAVKAMSTLVYVVGYSQERYEAGVSLGQAAEVMHGIAHGDEMLLSGLYNNLGVVLLNQGDYDNALAYYQKSLAIRKKILGNDHPDIGKSLNNLGGLFHCQGEYDKALDHFQQALKIYHKAFGPDHPSVSWPLYNMGNVFQARGEYTKALDYHLRALAIYQAAVGENNAGIGDSLLEIADILRHQGRLDEALEYNRKCRQLYKQTLDPTHPNVAWALSSLGEIYLKKGMHQKAIQSLERALEICQQRTCQAVRKGRTLFALAKGLARTGQQRDRAIKLAKKASVVFGKDPYLHNDRQEVDNWLLNYQGPSNTRQTKKAARLSRSATHRESATLDNSEK